MEKIKWLGMFILLLILTIFLVLGKITDVAFVSISGAWLIVFILSMIDLETISEIKIGAASIKRDVQAAKEIRKELEEISETIRSQKEEIDIMTGDIKTAKAKEKAREEEETRKRLIRMSATGRPD